MEQNDQNDRQPTPVRDIGDIAADDLFTAADNNIDSSARPVPDDNAAFERDVDAEFHRLVEEQRQRDAQRAAANRRRRVEAAAQARFDRYPTEQSRAPSTTNGTAHAAVNNADLGRDPDGGWGRVSPRFPRDQRPRRLSPFNNADLGRGREGGWDRVSPRFPGEQRPRRLSPASPRTPATPPTRETMFPYQGLGNPDMFQPFFDFLTGLQSNGRRRSGGRHPFEYEP